MIPCKHVGMSSTGSDCADGCRGYAIAFGEAGLITPLRLTKGALDGDYISDKQAAASTVMPFDILYVAALAGPFEIFGPAIVGRLAIEVARHEALGRWASEGNQHEAMHLTSDRARFSEADRKVAAGGSPWSKYATALSEITSHAIDDARDNPIKTSHAPMVGHFVTLVPYDGFPDFMCHECPP
jgi:hypothetical protein